MTGRRALHLHIPEVEGFPETCYLSITPSTPNR